MQRLIVCRPVDVLRPVPVRVLAGDHSSILAQWNKRVIRWERGRL